MLSIPIHCEWLARFAGKKPSIYLTCEGESWSQEPDAKTDAIAWPSSAIDESLPDGIVRGLFACS